MAFQDRELICKDCGTTFIFSAGEQEFYETKGFQNDPVRCPQCRTARKQKTSAPDGRTKEVFTATCSNCGTETQVPFKPRGHRPVYCRDCYQAIQQAE